MNSSTSCSSRLAALLLAAVLLCGCAGARTAAVGVPPSGGPGMKIAVFPPENLSGGSAPVREIRQAVEAALRERGLDIVDDAGLEKFMAKHRIRYTGGIDPEGARAMRQELGVGGVLITSIELYSVTAPPKFSMTLRLVSTGEPPSILWIDGVGIAGDDSPGLLGLGLVYDPRTLMETGTRRLAGSLSAFLSGRGGRAASCPAPGRFMPKVSYRSPELDPGRKYTVAVMPFLNETERRNAGDAVSLEFIRQLAATDNFVVLEPGVVRDQLLRYRVIMEGGVSIDTARVVLSTLNADLVLAGYVLDYEDYQGTYGTPKVNFTAMLLNKKDGEVVWESTSYNEGDDGVFFFDLGKINTASSMTCRMVSGIVGMMTEK